MRKTWWLMLMGLVLAFSGVSASAASTRIVVAEAWGSGPWAGMFDEWKEVFESRHPGVEIEFITLTGAQEDIRAQLLTMIAGGVAPDINMWVWPDIAEYFVDLGPYFERDPEISLDDFFWTSVEASTMPLEGRTKVYQMPGNPDAQMLWVNLDALSEAGIGYNPDVPWTWPEFMQNAGRLQRVTGEGDVARYAASFPFSWPWAVGPWVWSNEGTILVQNQDTGYFDRSEFNHPQTVETLNWLRGLYERDFIGGDFASGSAVMLQSWSSTASRELPFNFDVMPIPVPDAGSPSITLANGSGLGGISVESKNPDLAWEVLKFIASDEGDCIRMKYMVHIPSVVTSSCVDLWLEKSNNFRGDIYLDAVQAGHLGPNVKLLGRDGDVTSTAGSELQRFFDGEISAVGVVESIDRRVNAIFDDIKAGN